MYNEKNLDIKRPEWTISRQNDFSKILLSHYVADIISNEWHDGGGSKVYTAIKEKRYSEAVTKKRWELLLDNYYQTQLQNKQRDRFSNPLNADSVILNCVYVNIFTAADHLSTNTFDIEHLATKERMKTIMKQFDDLRLPVSCIANFCYLPTDINRGKKEKTIYETSGLSMNIRDIEKKFSFTVSDNLKWISIPYSNDERDLLISNYQEFLDGRYKIIKEKFLSLFYPN